MPAMPPPTTSTESLTCTRRVSSGLWCRTRRTAPRISASAFSVAARLSVCTQDACSRMLTIWN